MQSIGASTTRLRQEALQTDALGQVNTQIHFEIKANISKLEAIFNARGYLLISIYGAYIKADHTVPE